jgi:hypothetical protein
MKKIIGWASGLKPDNTIYIPRAGEKISKGPGIIYMWKF